MIYTTYMKNGRLHGGYLPDGFYPEGMNDEQKAEGIVSSLDPPDVRKLDMNQLQIDLHNALIAAAIDKRSTNHQNFITTVTSVVVRHLAALD